MMRRTNWSEPGVSSALCWLAIEDRKRDPAQRISLPPALYSEAIAPFLHFDNPLPDQLYVLGGRNQHQEPLDVVEMFDTWHGKWTACPRMMLKRAGCAAASLADGRLLISGGYDERGIVTGVLSATEVFDPVAQVWSLLPDGMKRARWGHGCATLQGLVYAVGGCALRPGMPASEDFMETLRSCEVFDSLTGVWTASANLHVARAGARVMNLGGTRLVVVGGCDDVFGRAEMLSSVEVFDPKSHCWSLLPTHLSIPRTTAAAAPVDDCRILITGGAPSLSSAEFFCGAT